MFQHFSASFSKLPQSQQVDILRGQRDSGLFFNTQSGAIQDVKVLPQAMVESIESGLYLPVEEALAILNQFDQQVRNYNFDSQHDDIVINAPTDQEVLEHQRTLTKIHE